MALPLKPPLLPQLARPAKKLPTRRGLGRTSPNGTASAPSRSSTATDVYLQSRSGKPLRRYFPELTFPEGRYVLDGEIVLFDAEGRQDFDALGQRIHPAESRINMLAEQTPTRFIAFDLLALDDESLLELPQAERRDRLGGVVADAASTSRPRTEDPDEAQPWLQGAEGVIAKRQDAPLPARRARRHGQDQARAHDRRRRHGLAPGQGGGHRRLADPRPLRRRRQAAHGRPHLRPQRQATSASCSASSRPTRPASAAWATRAAGTTSATSSGSSCGRSSSSRSPSTTRATTASATAPRSRAGATTRSRRSAGWSSSQS